MNNRKFNLRTGIIAVAIILLSLATYFIIAKSTTKQGRATPIGSEKSIAVLEFANTSKDSGQEYLIGGLSEGILNALAHVDGLKVCAGNSSLKDTSGQVNVRQEAIKLGVGALLIGSVQLHGDSITIIASLFNAKESSNAWSGSYDEKLDDIFSLQNKISNDIADELDVTFLKNNQNVAINKPTNMEAYRLYLKGRAAWNIRTSPELTKAIDFFQRAIEIDTSYALAYSGLADCYTALGYGSFIAPRDAFPKALDFAARALSLDSTLAEPHAVLGYYHFYYDWDWARAEQEYRRCIALNPNYALGYDWYAYYLTAMRRYDEAYVILAKAKDLDPLSVAINTDMGFSYYYGHHYQRAIDKLEASINMNSNFLLAHIWLGRTHQAMKMFPEAIEQYKKALHIAGNWPVALAAIGNVYGESGDTLNAYRILDTLHALSSKRFVTSYGVALVYAGLNEKEQAFLWLNKAYDERSNWLVWIQSDPRWATIKTDNRFTQLEARVGLPK
jgi:TolB-like protein/Tfp pilus assembly protein PilF